MEIYLDNAATTKPLIGKAFEYHIREGWYNPSCAYSDAAKVFAHIKETRELLKSVTGAKGDCIFTSGGTEANNTVIMSALKSGAHFITSAVEHPSTYNAFKHLEALGVSVEYIKPRGFCIRAQDVAEAVRENTALVSIMHVNNETGALNDITETARAVKAKNPRAMFHSDGVQALFKTPVSLSPDIDYYTVSAHKIHALKGTGAILTGERGRIKRLLHGGEQEMALRPGTENTLGIQALHEALTRGSASFVEDAENVGRLRQRLLKLLESTGDAVLNIPDASIPHIVNVSFPGVRAEVLVRALGEKGIYIGTGAACSRGKVSRVLTESGIKSELAEGAVRISMSALNTQNDIEICAEALDKAVKKLRAFGRR